jgi:hypothetical protein
VSGSEIGNREWSNRERGRIGTEGIENEGMRKNGTRGPSQLILWIIISRRDAEDAERIKISHSLKPLTSLRD